MRKQSDNAGKKLLVLEWHGENENPKGRKEKEYRGWIRTTNEDYGKASHDNNENFMEKKIYRLIKSQIEYLLLY